MSEKLSGSDLQESPSPRIGSAPTAARAAPRQPPPRLLRPRAPPPSTRPALDRGFRRLLAQRATATSGYDPSLLRGVSYKVEDSDADSPVRVVQPVPADEQQRLHSPAAVARVRSGTSSSIRKTIIGHPNIVPVLSNSFDANPGFFGSNGAIPGGLPANGGPGSS
ncbi:hypothetical protein ZWY2020_003081 [Hordeum vulgare]|nr:hypothetical protein ZWY2020_003081 [Hordeum vulgare]